MMHLLKKVKILIFTKTSKRFLSLPDTLSLKIDKYISFLDAGTQGVILWLKGENFTDIYSTKRN